MVIGANNILGVCYIAHNVGDGNESDSTISSETNVPQNEEEDKKVKEMKLLDLFSGCGAMSTGLCLGANMSGVHLVTGPHTDFSGPTSGSTACVVIIKNNQVVANAGDSRCVISRKGQAYNLSRDHKPELEVEKERILKAGGFIHAGRVNGSLNLARAIVR